MANDRALAIEDPGNSPGVAVRDTFLRVRGPHW
jgi:hypothetical protein